MSVYYVTTKPATLTLPDVGRLTHVDVLHMDVLQTLTSYTWTLKWVHFLRVLHAFYIISVRATNYFKKQKSLGISFEAFIGSYVMFRSRLEIRRHGGTKIRYLLIFYLSGNF